MKVDKLIRELKKHPKNKEVVMYVNGVPRKILQVHYDDDIQSVELVWYGILRGFEKKEEEEAHED